MILQSLYRYYEAMLTDPDAGISPPGYSAANVNFVLNLSSEGEILDIVPLNSKFFDGKQDRERNYQRMVVPEKVKRSSGIQANFLCDNVAYVLGISDKDSEKPNYSSTRFEAFRNLNILLLEKANNENARAVIAFLRNHDPLKALTHPVIARNLDILLKGGNLIFWVEGRNTLDDPEMCHVWEEGLSDDEALKMQCLVTGQVEPVARLHPSVQGVRDANPTGASLVGFNDRAYESYNRVKEQGRNSPTSQRVASGYGIALNYLLSSQNPNRKIYLGDTTVVYWAESQNKEYAGAFASLIDPSYLSNEITENQDGRRDIESRLSVLAEKVRKGQPMDISGLGEELDPNVRFYVLGLAPNAARLAVRFFLTDPFGSFIERIMLHYEDLSIQKEFSDQADYISPNRILSECVSPKVTRREEELKSSWGLLGGALMWAILTGAPYPEALYLAFINRIRHDNDEEGKSRKINYVRASFIKAHLLRKYRRQDQNPYQEVLQMSLNESYSHPAYVLGRLFAWLEKAQREAIGDVNASIKDRFFTSACATPASAFPTLLKLSHHHTAKAEFGGVTDRKIQETLDLLEAKPFPAHLTLDEQGLFILGYYHQRANFYTKKTSNSVEA